MPRAWIPDPDTFVCRPDTQDAYTVREMGGYRLLNLQPNDVVLDLGGNIGAFARWACDVYDVAQVISVEPFPANCKQYRRNTRVVKSRVQLYPAAVTGERIARTTQLFVSNTGNQGSHTVIPRKSRNSITVPTIPFTYLLDTHKPTVIKCDIEGAEYGLPWAKLPKRVRAIAAELHYAGPKDLDLFGSAQALLTSWLRQGFEIVKGQPLNRMNPKLWHAVYVLQR